MSFSTGYLGDPQEVAGGEIFGDGLDLGYSKGHWTTLNTGRFVRIVAGIVENLDGTADPQIVGIAHRNVANAVEDGGELSSVLFDNVTVRRERLISVDVTPTANEAPPALAAVLVSNAGDANDGLATSNLTTGIESNAEFIRVLRPNVWLVNLKNV